MTWKVKTAPTALPLSMDELKAHLGIVTNDHDAAINQKAWAAVGWVQTYARLSIMPQTQQVLLRRFPVGSGEIVLPQPPARLVTSVAYTDTDGVAQTLAAAGYTFDADAWPATLVPAYGESWPSARLHAGSVVVEYEAGWASADAVPSEIKQAILLLVGSWMENREEVVVGTIATQVPFGIRDILRPFRCVRVRL